MQLVSLQSALDHHTNVVQYHIGSKVIPFLIDGYVAASITIPQWSPLRSLAHINMYLILVLTLNLHPNTGLTTDSLLHVLWFVSGDVSHRLTAQHIQQF
jgi:hypothetical protein